MTDQPHPLSTDDALIPTPELEYVVNELNNWLDELYTGGVIWGSQRTGKTHGIRFLIKYAAGLLGLDIPMAMMTIWESSQAGATVLAAVQ